MAKGDVGSVKSPGSTMPNNFGINPSMRFGSQTSFQPPTMQKPGMPMATFNPGSSLNSPVSNMQNNMQNLGMMGQNPYRNDWTSKLAGFGLEQVPGYESGQIPQMNPMMPSNLGMMFDNLNRPRLA